ncbi:hypothetical protein K458DRAFT_419690 [Lentithecium fluviatile CBS 122367]|uniref:C3H1-type domain-containing protein n=1 Tax=Lentithecium fluviatile CBS 122367 TaxID=1168545 RepID=A0A6G1IXL3_9PLEO|nr:hypothetical protein K458DRAFT_419690 [Lentithecium fluviatile CBS 122367]
MSTPAGMQTMAAFANHMTSANGATPCPQSPVLQSHPPQNHGSPPSVGSKKRKRDERQRQFEAKPKPQPVASAQQPGKKPPRAKCKAPPEVPSFGFALPPTSVSRPSASSAASSSSPKKKSRVHLGLSRREAVDESSEGEDIDEEAAFVTKCKVEGAVFEHNGESISLQTQAEVAAWIKDRRRQFPTQKRIEQKAEEAAAKRANELEFLRKIKGQPAREKSGDQQGPASKPAQKKKPPAEPNRNLEELRKKVKESLAKQKTVSLEPQPDPQVLDLGLGYATDTASESGLSVLSDSSILSSSSVLSSDAGSGSDADDSDAPPGAQSAKAPIAPVVVPPPAPKLALPKPKQEKNGICAHWKKHGKCRHGQNCKHSHPGDGKAKRVGLYERMVEQELEKADRLALDAIKYLGQNGFLG